LTQDARAALPNLLRKPVRIADGASKLALANSAAPIATGTFTHHPILDAVH
jgi:hypothetical protein